MNRLIITLCLMSRVWSAVTIQRHIYSHQISRMARTDPTSSSLIGRSYNKFDDNPGKFDFFAHTEQSNYDLKDPIEFKTAEKLRSNSGAEADLISFNKVVTESYRPLPFTPVTNYDYSNKKKPRKIETANVGTGFAGNKIKYRKNAMNDEYYGYDNDFPNDEEDVKTSGRNTYENYASFFYHNPYEVYDHNSIDMDKAKDKRYADISEKVIPVHETIENDTTFTPAFEVSTAPYDNPIGGNGPFFSFVLNDYFDRNHDEDTLSFKGLAVDWGKDFDHESYVPADDTRRDRRLENYFTPIVEWLTTPRPDNQFRLIDQSVTQKTHNQNIGYDKHDVGERKHSTYRNNDGNVKHKYEGFKDFLDSFANKFGLAENKGDSNYVRETNNDKGERKNGFHRVYHKDEFLEDKEFFDRTNSSQKAADKASSKFNLGGSEALLRSQAFATSKEAANANSNFSSNNNDSHENSFKGDSNTLTNNFDKYINVAKQAARSNNADYLDE